MKMTYRETYRAGCTALSHIRDGQLDARLLLEHVCGTSMTTMIAEPDRPVSDAERAAYHALVTRRAGGEPLAYVLGETEFMGLVFHVDRRVLIPEQDTENLVEEVLRSLHDGMRILDLCTGSGCIALSLLHYSNGTTAWATDLSADALCVARGNAEALGQSDRVTFRQGDLFGALEGDGAAAPVFDVIVTNPPYVRPDVIAALPAEVRAQPMMALDGGADGLAFYRRIAAEAGRFLTGGGLVFAEIGYDQGEAVREIFVSGGWKDAEIIKDYGGNDRILSARKSAIGR